MIITATISDPASSDPHLRRLQADYEAMRTLVSASPLMRMTVMGQPPHRYRVIFQCKGIFREAESGRLRISTRHIADIYLHVDYPRLAPHVIWRTPIFHPNFKFANGSGEVCVPTWTPGRSLAEFVLQIGRMIQYQEHNATYALNWDAAIWAQEHADRLPVDKRPLAARDVEAQLAAFVEASP